MTIILTCEKFRSLYVEFNTELGKSPLFLKEVFNGEVIIHMPFTEIIYTPNHILKDKAFKDHETRNRNFS